MKKKLVILSIIIIIVAAFVVAAVGFNVDLKYTAHKSVIIPIGESYNMDDVKKITDEVLGKNNIVLEKSGLYDDEVSIRIADITDEQLETLKNKFNEKYNIVQDVYVQIGDDYSIDDVKAIANEVFEKEDAKVEKDSQDEKYAKIEAGLLTEKDIENFNNKINEKFGITNSSDSIGATNVVATYDMPNVRLRDMASQYLREVIIATVIIIVYYLVRFSKLGLKDILQDSVTVLVFSEALYMSIIGVTRIPVNNFVFVLALAMYIGVFTYLNIKYTAKLEKLKTSK